MTTPVNISVEDLEKPLIYPTEAFVSKDYLAR